MPLILCQHSAHEPALSYRKRRLSSHLALPVAHIPEPKTGLSRVTENFEATHNKEITTPYKTNSQTYTSQAGKYWKYVAIFYIN